MDVKNAFVNGDLQDEVYMASPQGVSHNQGEVCKLNKTLYGLKQAPRAWFKKFTTMITSIGFRSSDHASALFVKTTYHGRILFSLYVDDMIITGDDMDIINDLKLHLSKQFEMKDLCTLRYFLGIEVAYSLRGYLLSQSKYIVNILEHTCLSHDRVTDNPLELNVKYAPSDGVSCQIPHYIVLWLAGWCNLRLLEQILLMLFMLLVNL